MLSCNSFFVAPKDDGSEVVAMESVAHNEPFGVTLGYLRLQCSAFCVLCVKEQLYKNIVTRRREPGHR